MLVTSGVTVWTGALLEVEEHRLTTVLARCGGLPVGGDKWEDLICPGRVADTAIGAGAEIQAVARINRARRTSQLGSTLPG